MGGRQGKRVTARRQKWPEKAKEGGKPTFGPLILYYHPECVKEPLIGLRPPIFTHAVAHQIHPLPRGHGDEVTRGLVVTWGQSSCSTEERAEVWWISGYKLGGVYAQEYYLLT